MRNSQEKQYSRHGGEAGRSRYLVENFSCSDGGNDIANNPVVAQVFPSKDQQQRLKILLQGQPIQSNELNGELRHQIFSKKPGTSDPTSTFNKRNIINLNTLNGSLNQPSGLGLLGQVNQRVFTANALANNPRRLNMRNVTRVSVNSGLSPNNRMISPVNALNSRNIRQTAEITMPGLSSN